MEGKKKDILGYLQQRRHQVLIPKMASGTHTQNVSLEGEKTQSNG